MFLHFQAFGPKYLIPSLNFTLFCVSFLPPLTFLLLLANIVVILSGFLLL